MKKQELQKIIREELQSVLKEADTYRSLKSDINETWDTPKIVESDLYNFLENTFDSGGPDLLKDNLNAVVKALSKAKSLMNKK